MPVIQVPSALRRYTGQQARIPVAGATVADALDNLVEAAPEMRNHLFAAGALRPFVLVSRNGQDIRLLQGLGTPVAGDDEIRILASIAGG
ncbi:molybdopterin synthase sulfur carrier subunit [Pseudoroseomonas rhizosphaerae]|uniref:Molybdopterin synthase sulfur carrier subunit n=1 Tax=Teichococcus rhizosphaerae TaxID=1335062 RepID=A0A2C7A6E2_9PROT|nr:MoaD/ThiS family protein [Pseudoroseomonas rhizosphaerae]PHK93920.1 molybdopterin synthase sulfur carrier subunit [Pseudoroseomonas rhizosphaerae]